MTSNNKTNIYTKFFNTETLDAVPVWQFDEYIDGINTRRIYLHADGHTENISERDNLLHGELTDLEFVIQRIHQPSELKSLATILNTKSYS